MGIIFTICLRVMDDVKLISKVKAPHCSASTRAATQSPLLVAKKLVAQSDIELCTTDNKTVMV